MLVAVYGTLKRGYGNHRLLEHCEYLGEDRIDGYRLFYSGSEGSFPVAVPDEGSKISVEVFSIGDCERTLRSLDSLEGTPWMYTRELGMTSEDPREVSFYVGNPECFGTLSNEVPSKDGVFTWSRERYGWE